MILINPFQKYIIFAWKEQAHPEKELVKKQVLHKGFFHSSSLAEVPQQIGTCSYTGLSCGRLLPLSFPVPNEAVVHTRHTKELIAGVSPGKLLSNIAGPWHQHQLSHQPLLLPHDARGPAPALHSAAGKCSENLAHFLRSCSLIKLT